MNTIIIAAGSFVIGLIVGGLTAYVVTIFAVRDILRDELK